MAINSRLKGKRGELQAAHLHDAFGLHARRTQQVRGTQDSPDIEVLEWRKTVHIEVKFGKHVNIQKAMLQAKRDCERHFENGESYKIPLVYSKTNQQDWLVTIPAKEAIMILKYYFAAVAEKNGQKCS